MGPAFAMTLGGLFTCIAQQVQVSIELNDGYTITHAHSRYKYEPAQLPSREITFKLNDLNAEEKRNLLFQIHVPKLSHNQENANITNTQQMTQSQQTEDAQLFENHSIGKYTCKNDLNCSSNSDSFKNRKCKNHLYGS